MSRNRDFRIVCILWALLTLLALGLTGRKAPELLLPIFALCVGFLLLYIWSTRRRYRAISNMAAELDRLLHTDSPALSAQDEEGELAVLHSVLSKLLLRLREQQSRLTGEKQYLADSLADVSHQLRTPLTSIHLLLTMLSEPTVTPDRQRQLVRELHTLVSRLDWLITALLKISKLDAGTVQMDRETLPLSELLHRAMEPLEIPLELRGQSLSVSAEGTFRGDIRWTSEALVNIVKNCMEHNRPEGTIEIRARENPLYVEICILDQGPGIPPEDLPHIFERFYKGSDSGDQSFGIGLALSRRIITAQNGTVRAGNRRTGGAAFEIRFYKSSV